MFIKELELSAVFIQGLVIPPGDLHCNGNTELNEQMGCILGVLCCVKTKGLLYLLFFGGRYLLWSRCSCYQTSGSVFCHSDVLHMQFLIAAMVTFLHGRKISAGKLFGSWYLDDFLG